MVSVNIHDHLQGEVARIVREGFGDMNAPLAEGEQIVEKRICPHVGCAWELPMRWQRGTTTTRQRGLLEFDRLAQAHLEEHVASNWAGESPS